MPENAVKLTVLASGSAGNCSLVQAGGVNILVDAGLSGKRTVERLAGLGLGPGDIAAVLITHEHSDHVMGLPVLAKRHHIPVHANHQTAAFLRTALGKYEGWCLFETGSVIDFGPLQVESFPVPHDAYDPVGFVVRGLGKSLAFLTDLGYATRLVIDRVREVDLLLLEANYDPQLLQKDTKRPWSVKQRIMQRNGHLSNEAAAQVVEQVLTPRLRHLLLGHLSEDCNTPELAEAVVAAKLREVGATHVTLHRTYRDRSAPTLVL